jgi:hypothetical protein
VASVASASAAVTTVEVTGKCTIKGTVTFKPALNVVLKEREYKFKSSSVECETTPKTSGASVEVSGKAELSCAVSLGEPPLGKAGSGSTTYTPELEPPEPADTDAFTFEFNGVGNQVPFKATGEDVNAKGTATFPAAALTECEEKGAKELPFTAEVEKGGKL